MLAEKEIVEEVQSPQTEATLEEARRVSPEAALGDMVLVESTPEDFGRVAAQTAKQVILQRLREAERDAQYEEFADREGDMVHGTVHSITPQAVTVGLGRAEAILPRNQQIPGEGFRVRDRIRVYVLEVRKSSRGPVIVVTRTHPNMLRRLLEMEVPEINTGLVEIKAIAREAGKRAKVAVAALRDGIDPVGACVGLRGVRIQSIVRDLNDEKIDVIEWNSDSATFILKALSPARVSGVYLDEDPERGRTALVVVPEDQLSLAIGRAGVNARLAARLTGWRIDIKSLVEAAAESLNRLRTDPLYTDLIERFAESLPHVEAILAKKEEGRPVTPEEYSALTSFVERVQREVEARRGARRLAYLEKLAAVRGQIPASAYETPLAQANLPERVLATLSEGGYDTCGKVLEQLGMNADRLLALEGFGPKVVEELREVLQSHPYALPEPEPVAEIPEVPEVAEAEAEPVEGLAVAEGEAPAEALEAAVPAEGELAVAAEGGDTLEKAFQAIAEQISAVAAEGALEDEEEGEAGAGGKKKKGKKKKGARTVVFDEATGGLVVQKRRKPGRGGGWDTGEL
ncbi:MAG: transcription termination/antitermination protein NusA, partial [Chloroflexi bacterium]|nr:transcription termination/antitermination protein NusA [Chloroflexota bacterium]